MIKTAEDDMALARVSAVELSGDWKNKPRKILDQLVMPTTSTDYIIDTRTSITGLNAKQLEMRGVSKSDALSLFKNLLKPQTILIGHALEHDLLALGINFGRVIDTALLFSVEGKDKEFTHSLAHVSSALLEQSTSRDERGGVHDSVEDAMLSVEIVREILLHPSLYNKTFPISLPAEQTAAKRRLQNELGAKAMLLSNRLQAAESSLRARINELKSDDLSTNQNN